MRNRISILVATIVIAILASSCVGSVFVLPAVPFPDTAPIQFDFDLDGVREDYFYPNVTAEVIENSAGQFVVAFSADLRSPDLVGTWGIVTLNGVQLFNASLIDSAGTYVLPVGSTGFVEVWADWRETTQLVWTGWIA